jgi:hypothetical protein
MLRERFEGGVELFEFSAELQPAERQQPKRPLHDLQEGHVSGWPKPCAPSHARCPAKRHQLSPQRVRRRDDQAPQLITRLGTGLYGAPASHRDSSKSFYQAGSGLRRRRSLAGEHGPRGILRVGGIVLAEAAPPRSIGTIDLDHLNAGVGEMAREPGTIAPGAFDACSLQHAERPSPSQQLLGPGNRRRDGYRATGTSKPINYRTDVCIEVSINTKNDLAYP